MFQVHKYHMRFHKLLKVQQNNFSILRTRSHYKNSLGIDLHLKRDFTSKAAACK